MILNNAQLQKRLDSVKKTTSSNKVIMLTESTIEACIEKAGYTVDQVQADHGNEGVIHLIVAFVHESNVQTNELNQAFHELMLNYSTLSRQYQHKTNDHLRVVF